MEGKFNSDIKYRENLTKKTLFFLSLLILCFLFWPLMSQRQKKKIIKVLTYSSFSGVYGPGRVLEKQFEAFCDCDLQWLLAEDSTALLQRFSMTSDIDVVLGWDQMAALLDEQKIWEDLSLLTESLVREEKFFEIKNPYFLPIDWAPIGFLYRDLQWDVKSLKSLSQIEGKISFPAPRISTLGFQFYYWIYEVFEGDLTQIESFLKNLKDKVYGPLSSWSMAYGLFQKGHTDMGLSYLSSLLYHKEEEKNKNYFLHISKKVTLTRWNFFQSLKVPKKKLWLWRSPNLCFLKKHKNRFRKNISCSL